MVECENCCQIHFYDSDLKVKHQKTGEYIGLDDWYGLPLREAEEYTIDDNGNWISLTLPCYIFCLVCGELYEVVNKRLSHVLQINQKWLGTPVEDLVKAKELVIFNRENGFQSELIYGPEEEV